MTSDHPITGQWTRAKALMEQRGLDALFVTEKFNYWLLTGHHSRQHDGKQRPMILVLPLKGEPVMIVYGRDERMVRLQVPVSNMKTYLDVPYPVSLIPDTLKEMGLERATIGCELGEFQRLGISVLELQSVQSALPGATFVDAAPIFNHFRMVKAPWEIDRMRKACALATEGWEMVLSQIHGGMSAEQVKKIIQTSMLEVGGEGGHITLGLEGDAYVHTFAKGDWLWCDFGTAYKGYASDIARMALFGPPTAEQQRDWEKICELTRKLISRIGPGVKCSDLARATDEDMRRLGLAPLGAKRVGHGFGVTSDPPSISTEDETILQPGMVLTPEPRFSAASGQRMHIEEDVVVTDNGCELLSTGAFNLVVINR